MKILLSSVFGPFGVDDPYGRKENRMELFHNQVTREQGLFSIRFHHHSFGLYFIAENIKAPTLILDFPTEQRFIREIKKGYDYVGISFIVPNMIKARRMAELVRKHAPESKIVLGGHGTSIENVEELVDHDHICRGEGVQWFRRLLGENPDRPFRHPDLPSGFQKRLMGVPLGNESYVLVPGVGCPNACRFCATSHFFEKKYTPYFDTGEELFEICTSIEDRTGCGNFFIMDENFLKRPERARKLLSLMEENDRPFRFAMFSSAETITDLGAEFLQRLGVYFVWIGVESKREVYEKNRGVDIKDMIRNLRDHGVGVLASGILFSEHHDADSIWEDIRFMVDLESDLVQFMQLGPLPGTALYKEYDRQGKLAKEVPFEEWHGQHRIWFRHPHFTAEESETILRDAFRYDYDTQGSSLLRMSQTILRGYQNLRDTEDPFLLRRRDIFESDARNMRRILGVMEKYAHTPEVRERTREIRALYQAAFGPLPWGDRIAARIAGVFAARHLKRIERGQSVSQPALQRKKYRMAAADLVTEALRGKQLSNLLQIDIQWEENPVLLHLKGTLDRVNSKALARKIRRYLKGEGETLTLNLDQLEAIEDQALNRLLRRIRKFSDRILLHCADSAQSIRDAIASLPKEYAVSCEE